MLLLVAQNITIALTEYVFWGTGFILETLVTNPLAFTVVKQHKCGQRFVLNNICFEKLVAKHLVVISKIAEVKTIFESISI